MCFRCVGVAVQSGEFANSKIIESVLLEPTRLRAKNCSGKRYGCRNHCFSGLFFDIRHLGHRSACPVSFVSMVAVQRYQGAMLRNQRSDLPTLVVVVTPAGNPTMLD